MECLLCKMPLIGSLMFQVPPSLNPEGVKLRPVQLVAGTVARNPSYKADFFSWDVPG